MDSPTQFSDIENKDSYIQCVTIPGTQAQTAANFSYVLTAGRVGLEITAVGEKHEVAGSDATAKLDVFKVPNAQAISYSTGTITSIANGATAVVGSGTTWVASMVGQSIKIYGNGDGVWYKIATVTDATHLVLASNYKGTTIAAATEPYIIGYTILASSYSLNSTANTWVLKQGTALSTVRFIRYLEPGESVGLKVTGTLTALQGVHVCIYYKVANNGSYR